VSGEIVVFDLAGVLCRFHPERRLAGLSAASGGRPSEIEEAIWGSGLDARAELGDFAPPDLYQRLLAVFEGEIGFEQLRAAWAAAFEIDEEVCRVARAVRVPRCLFTNNGPMLTACLDQELRSLLEVVERAVCSWQLGVRKPDREAFLRLAAELGVRPSVITFVDDTAANCRGAEEAGLRAIHFEGPAALRSDLEKLGLLASP